jgi:hypothetical protein
MSVIIELSKIDRCDLAPCRSLNGRPAQQGCVGHDEAAIGFLGQCEMQAIVG